MATRTWRVLVSAVGLGLLAASYTQGQQPAQQVLRVRDFTALGNSAGVRTPDYRTDVGRGRSPKKYWAMISTSYDTAPDWIDELDFRYYVLTSQREGALTRFYFFSKVVRYVDIQQGRGRTSAVFLHSKAVERYGMPVAAAVEIVHEGKVIAGNSDSGSLQLPERWWTMPEILNREDVVRKEGYLLNRAESPWALVNIDDYEVIR